MGGMTWPIRRATGGQMLFWLVIGGAGFALIDWFAYRRLNLTLLLGFRLDALRHAAILPWWRPALEAAFDIALVVVSIARLHDVSRSGWWLSALPAAPVAVMLGAPATLGLVVLAAWIALILWPGTIGPNHYGPDPRGWASRAQFDAQQRELARQPGGGLGD